MNPNNQPTPQLQGNQSMAATYNELPPNSNSQPVQQANSSFQAIQPAVVPVGATPTNATAPLELAVSQAHAAIEQTRLDPFQQVKAIESIKAAYILKGFGKTIKVSEN